MTISEKSTIKEIQDEFNKLFPGLKIEFYKSQHGKYKTSSDADRLSPESKLNEISANHKLGELNFQSDDSVARVEEEMFKKFGLNVQIYRRSKELWLQTSTTDDWSLAKQNSKGLHSLNSLESSFK